MKTAACIYHLTLALVNVGAALANTRADSGAAVAALNWFAAGWCAAVGLMILVGWVRPKAE